MKRAISELGRYFHSGEYDSILEVEAHIQGVDMPGAKSFRATALHRTVRNALLALPEPFQRVIGAAFESRALRYATAHNRLGTVEGLDLDGVATRTMRFRTAFDAASPDHNYPHRATVRDQWVENWLVVDKRGVPVRDEYGQAIIGAEVPRANSITVDGHEAYLLRQPPKAVVEAMKRGAEELFGKAIRAYVGVRWPDRPNGGGTRVQEREAA